MVMIQAAELLAVSLVASAPAQVAREAAPRAATIVPSQQTSLRPGRHEIRIVFSRPMRPNSFSLTTVRGQLFPALDGKPQLSRDGKVFRFRANFSQPGTYGIGVNGGRFRNFVSLSGTPAMPRTFTYRVR